jgi:outer membrane protein insertion porin family
LIGTLGLSFNNFSTKNFFDKEAWRPIPTGDGQKLSLRLQSYGKGYLSYSASFTEPWLGGRKPTSLTLSYYHSIYGNAFTASASDYSFTIDGLSVGLGKRLKWPDDFFTLRQSINLQRYKLKNYTQIFSFGDGTGQYNTISYKIDFGRNSIDAPIFPRQGSNVSLSLEVTPPWSMFDNKDYTSLTEDEKFKLMEFHKWKFKGAWYKNVFGDLVVSFRTQYGFLGAFNQDIGTIPFDRFFLGGDGLTGYSNFDGREIIAMRGYSNYSLTPNYYQDKNTGGTIYNKNTLEIRYPLSLNPSATIYALGFVEAGNSWLNFKKFQPYNLYRSAGVGLRVFLPMFGLLGIDWGYGFDDVPGIEDANKGQFHFSIGQSLD